ncbi:MULTISPECIES: BrnT family toxin [unclassified Endozoicomonas]|uniref:BrnT family toxin n=1 Tax=unclassified Endozoicomonas TaxID=2644528 RepID=UPI002148E9FC|nr:MULTISPECIES: BrnT family toxin [unclassified Endozoicomonas]
MKYEYDADKDATNLAKHGLPLSEAEHLEWDTLWAWQDRRCNYGEQRMVGLAYLGLRLCCVVYTDRGDVRRIISLRKANKREMKRYAKA